MTRKEERALLAKGRTKKELKNYYSSQRVTAGMNTGTVSMKSGRDYDRKASKAEVRRRIKEEGGGKNVPFFFLCFFLCPSAGWHIKTEQLNKERKEDAICMIQADA